MCDCPLKNYCAKCCEKDRCEGCDTRSSSNPCSACTKKSASWSHCTVCKIRRMPASDRRKTCLKCVRARRNYACLGCSKNSMSQYCHVCQSKLQAAKLPEKYSNGCQSKLPETPKKILARPESKKEYLIQPSESQRTIAAALGSQTTTTKQTFREKERRLPKPSYDPEIQPRTPRQQTRALWTPQGKTLLYEHEIFTLCPACGSLTFGLLCGVCGCTLWPAAQFYSPFYPPVCCFPCE